MNGVEVVMGMRGMKTTHNKSDKLVVELKLKGVLTMDRINPSVTRLHRVYFNSVFLWFQIYFYYFFLFC